MTMCEECERPISFCDCPARTVPTPENAKLPAVSSTDLLAALRGKVERRLDWYDLHLKDTGNVEEGQRLNTAMRELEWVLARMKERS